MCKTEKSVNMSRRKKGITESEIEVLSAFLSGPKWYYQLYRGPDKVVGSNTTALRALRHLSELGLIRVDKELSKETRGRKRKYYAITFKGLLLAIQRDKIKPEKANGLKIGIPGVDDILSNPLLIMDMVNNFPEIFYGCFKNLDLVEISEGLLSVWISLSSWITLFHVNNWAIGKTGKYLDERVWGVVNEEETRMRLFYLERLAEMLKPIEEHVTKQTQRGNSHE